MHPSCFMLSFWLSWMPPCNAQCSQRKMVFKLKIEEHVEPSTTDYFFCIMVFSPPLCCLSINQVASLLVSLTPPASKDTFCLFRVFTCAPETNYWVTCCNFPKKWNGRKYCFYMPKLFFLEKTLYRNTTPQRRRLVGSMKNLTRVKNLSQHHSWLFELTRRHSWCWERFFPLVRFFYSRRLRRQGVLYYSFFDFWKDIFMALPQ